MLDLWYKNAVFYCVDVETFMDSDGDGIGDFQGLADRLDHVEASGATCLWLLPFYPSPNRDNGYDVSDYYGVDPRLGSLGDFVNFTRAAKDRGLRIIVDLVVNHTSIDHPWFQQARSDPQSKYRDWYVWSREKPEDAGDGIVFPGVQESTWTYDEAAGAWYFHRFYKHQPDLNITNPAVREEIEKIMGFWLELGVSGFRLDAVPFLIEYKGVEPQPERRDPHHYLTELRNFLSWRKAEAVMLGEANVPRDAFDEYFGSGDRLHLMFNFLLNQNVFLAFARGDARPVRHLLAEMPPIPPICQWATFLRNHDELDLGRLSAAEREEIFAAFAPYPDMQLYHRGIRRRLPPMFGGDRRRLEMAYSLLFALPGSPVLWYGEEIGMGEDLSLPERMPVRTPMQWADAANAGFSTAPPDGLIRPVISGGAFGYQRVNVTGQQHDRDSLLVFMQRLVRVRRACPEIGWGDCRVIETAPPGVLALHHTWRDNDVITLHNLGPDPAELRLDLNRAPTRLLPLFGDSPAPEPQNHAMPMRLEGYGYRWFRVAETRR